MNRPITKRDDKAYRRELDRYWKHLHAAMRLRESLIERFRAHTDKRGFDFLSDEMRALDNSVLMPDSLPESLADALRLAGHDTNGDN